MTDTVIADVERKLDEIVAKLKLSNDPEHKRQLLKQMRALMADLDRFVFGHDGLRKQ
jgi:hypothetical protein